MLVLVGSLHICHVLYYMPVIAVLSYICVRLSRFNKSYIFTYLLY